jgi:predicted nucleic acid-binding protein
MIRPGGTRLVIDTSALVAVLASEPERRRLIGCARNATLVAPGSVHWEVGNALVAMVRRGRLDAALLPRAVEVYRRIPLRLIDVDFTAALDLATRLGLYAYDAFVLACAREQRCGLLTLDRQLQRAARGAGVPVVEA